MQSWLRTVILAVSLGIVIGGLGLFIRYSDLLHLWRASPEMRHSPFTFHDAVARASSAVVSLRTLSQRDDRGQQKIGLGSGVIFDARGYIVTNHHVIDGASEILVILADGRQAIAERIGEDPETDLAVLRIALPNVPYLDFDEAPEPRIGDVVLSIGNPYGVGLSVSMGIVSATDRALNTSSFEAFIQTDAAINPGSSGGALVNTEGQIVGITSAFFSAKSDGINFALPVDLVRFVTERIVRDGRVIRGWLGVSGGLLSPTLIERYDLVSTGGVQITQVYPNSPAEKAGLREGDIIVRVNGQAIGDLPKFIRWVSRLEPGEQLTLEVLRQNADGKREHLRLSVTLAVKP
ncbi:MAG: PDZ domain-containing protein [Gammaproteobacteria bacterium]|nr:MAG: PDZ domain-containing protein [Gammaproteobacteria bacterium]